VQETITAAPLATVPVRSPRPAPDRRVRRAFLAALVAFFGIGAGWALALPVNGTYDENEHIVRAYGVASGQVYAKSGTEQVPVSLMPGDVQCQWQQRVPASCQVPAPADQHRVTMPTNAAGYSPVYYLPVGLPMLISPTYGGIIAGRLVSALLSALALAGAIAIAVRLNNRLLIGGLVLVATPLVMNLAGSINPNGLEISSAILLWCALLALVRPVGAAVAPPGDGALPRVPVARNSAQTAASPALPTHALVVVTAVTAALLMTIRHMGPVLLILVLATILVLARPGRVRELLRRRDMRWAAGIVFASGLLAVVWILTSGVTKITPFPTRTHAYGPFSTLRQIAVVRMPFYVQQIVGQFSYGETTLPSWVIIAWYMMLAALVLPAMLFVGRRYWLAALGLFVACLGVLVVLEFAFIHTAGWVAQSRYVLPSGVGVVLAACFVRHWQAALDGAAGARLVRLAAVVAVPVHLYALATVMTRFQIGPSSMMQPFHGSWLPKGGPVPALAVEVVGLAVLTVLAWRGTRGSAAEPAPVAGRGGDAATTAGLA
jgi:hypothetical protein